MDSSYFSQKMGTWRPNFVIHSFGKAFQKVLSLYNLTIACFYEFKRPKFFLLFFQNCNAPYVIYLTIPIDLDYHFTLI